jgi:hypothetical protein
MDPLDLLLKPEGAELLGMLQAALGSPAYQDFLWLSLGRTAEVLWHYRNLGKVPGGSIDCEIPRDHKALLVKHSAVCTPAGVSTRLVAPVQGEPDSDKGKKVVEMRDIGTTIVPCCLVELVTCLIDCYISQNLAMQLSMELKLIYHQQEQQENDRVASNSSSSSSVGRGAHSDAGAAEGSTSEMPCLDATVPCLLVRIPEPSPDPQQHLEQQAGDKRQEAWKAGSTTAANGGGEQRVKKKRGAKRSDGSSSSSSSGSSSTAGAAAAGGNAGVFRGPPGGTSLLTYGAPPTLEQLQVVLEVLLLVWKTQGDLLSDDKLINHASPGFVQSPLLLLLLLLLDHAAPEVKQQLLETRGELLFQLLYQVLLGRPDQFAGSGLKEGLGAVPGKKGDPGQGVQVPFVPWEVLLLVGEPGGMMGCLKDMDIRLVPMSHERRVMLSGCEVVNLLLQKLFFQPVGREALTAEGIGAGVDVCGSPGKSGYNWVNVMKNAGALRGLHLQNPQKHLECTFFCSCPACLFAVDGLLITSECVCYLSGAVPGGHTKIA